MTKAHFHTGSLAAAALLTLLVPSARADLIDTVPFSLTGNSSQQTISVPQFDPAQGALNSLVLSVSGSVQFVLEVFPSGPGPVSVTAEDTLMFSGTPLLAKGVFTSTIPSNTYPYTFMPPPVPLGTLVQDYGPNVVSFFTGTGTVPFQFSLGNAMVDQFSGPAGSSAIAFAGASGTVTADYAFTPAPGAAVPEPGTLGMAGFGVIAAGALIRRKRHYLSQKICSPLLFLAQS